VQRWILKKNMDMSPPVVSQECMKAYMSKGYPTGDICEFLSRVAPLKFREFSFSVPMTSHRPSACGGREEAAPEEYVLRYLSFDDPGGLAAEICKRSPSRIDVIRRSRRRML
jgi:hypothetical protein